MTKRIGLACLLALALFGCGDGGSGNGSGGASGADAAGGSGASSGVDSSPGGEGGSSPDMGALPDAASATAQLELSASVIEFGTVGVNATASESIDITNLTNIGVEIVAFDGLAPPFCTGRQLPLGVPQNAVRQVSFDYEPDAEGEHEAVVTLVTDPPLAEALSLTLRGTAAQAQAELVDDLLDFGVAMPGMPDARFIEVRNLTATIPLEVSVVDGIAAPFSIPVGQLPATVPPMQSSMILVQFQPQDSGEFEQRVTVVTNAGDFALTIRARVVAIGDLAIAEVSPAWAANDTDTTITIHGGPFLPDPDPDQIQILVADLPLSDVAWLDQNRVQGVLSAGLPAVGSVDDLVDVRVEIGASFGLAPDSLAITGPVAGGSTLDQDAVAGAGAEIGPEGNPWRVAVESIPANAELTIEPGTVILGAVDSRLTVEGYVSADGSEGQIVFGAEADWGGLVFSANQRGSRLVNVIVEQVDSRSAIEIGQATELSGITVRGNAGGGGIQVREGGTLVLTKGRIRDMAGDGIVLGQGATLFRLVEVAISGCQWAVTGQPGHFGSVIGAGHVWTGNAAGNAVGLTGPVSDVAFLSNQPAGVEYRIRDEVLEIAAGGTLRIASAAPLVLDGTLEVAGTLELPGGARLQAAFGGLIDVVAGGTLVSLGTPQEKVTLESRAPQGDPDPAGWLGVTFAGAAFDVEHTVIRDAGVTFNAAFGNVIGLAVHDSGGTAVEIAADGNLVAASFTGNDRSIHITAGTGRLAGQTLDREPQLTFDPTSLCGDWAFDGLQNGDNGSVVTNCD